MKRIKLLLISLFVLFNLIPATVYADEEVPYSLRAVPSENQVDDLNTYFDLAVKKNDTEKLQVEVFNNSDEKIKVEVSANTGASNSNGLLVYDGSIDEFDESLKHNFTDMADVLTPTLEIEPYDSKMAEVSVAMPDEDFEGTILGGLHFLLKDDSEEEAEGVQIKNNYAYEIAVVLNDKNSDKELKEKMELNEVNAGLIGGRTGLNVNFSNKAPILMTGTQINSAVYKKGSDEPLYERQEDNFSIAPNAIFKFPISFENNKLKDGDYTFKGTIKTKDNEFKFEKDFKITKDEAEEANEEAVELEKTDWKIFALIGSAIVILGLLIALIFMMLKRKK